MDRREIKKNKLDLEYHGESQKASTFLILLTTGLLAFFGSFLFLRDNELFIFGLFITIIIFILGLIFYNRSSKRMREIIIELGEIK